MKKAIMSLLSASITLSGFSSCEKDNDFANAASQTYVLVHGAWQAPYVWEAVKNNLEHAGNKVVVVELPGHGKDTTAAYTLSMDVYRDKVIDAISKVDGKVILVGHSMGGVVVTSVAEKIPAKIEKLVYIGAFVPTNNQSLAELSTTDPDSKLGPSLTHSADQLTLNVDKNNLIHLFIGDGSAAAKEEVLLNYRPEPAIPFGGKVTLTSENFGSVKKVYIKTLQDIVISPVLQDKMIAAANIKEIYSLNTSHSPFLSQPNSVAALLLTLAK